MSVDNVRLRMRMGMLECCILLLLHRQASYALDIIDFGMIAITSY